jgi:hypothetical protein
MTGLPEKTEAPEYYFKYIDRITNPDVVAELEGQLESAMSYLGTISEKASLSRYAPDKWSVREVLGHLNDCERLFQARAFWFARGLEGGLPSFEQEPAVATSKADQRSWESHVEEFTAVRLSTLAFFRNLPVEAWDRVGKASGYDFTVRALAYIAAGHVSHHLAILREKYGLNDRAD